MGIACRVTWLMTLVILALPATALAGAEVKVDRDFIASLIEKIPPAPFQKADKYRGSARGFHLVGIDPRGRRLLVGCEVVGDYKPPIAGAIRGDDGWKSFAFDVRVAVKVEPGLQGAPRFWVDVEEVKRRELEGFPGALAAVLGRHFDTIVTQVADGKAGLMSRKVNAQLASKMAAFKEYGVLREINYSADQLVLVFDVTRYRAEGVVGYVYAEPRPGTVPLHRWVRPRINDRYYTTSPQPPLNHPYYLYESIACHVFPTPQPGTVPLQRWRGAMEWYYTTDPEQTRVVRVGFRPETIAAYVYPEAQPGTVPLYRFVDPRTGVHFLTTHPHAEFAK